MLSAPAPTPAIAGVIVPDWPAPPGVRAVVTTRHFAGASLPPFDAGNLGARNGDDPAAVAANRALLERRLHLPASPRWLQQVHGIDVYDADTDARAADAVAMAAVADEPRADAAIARAAGAVLAVLTADCLPVLVCAEDGSTIGAAHAGWRGLAAGVIEATVARMRRPDVRLLAWLGPAIGAHSYEVGDEVRSAFVDADAGAATAFAATRAGHWRCDLYALARLRLARCGVADVYGGGFDTFADERFYSYRRSARTGRFATLIWRDGA